MAIEKNAFDAYNRLVKYHDARDNKIPIDEGDRIIIFDDIFPHLLSAFRIAEYNYYLNNIINIEVHTNPTAFTIINERRSYEEVKNEYIKLYPQHKNKIKLFDKYNDFTARLAYMIFLNNAYNFLGTIEKYKIPFVFTLYPGGGFEINNKTSDEKLRKICNSKYLRKIITTQRITYEYLLKNHFLETDKIVFIYGGVLPSNLYNNNSIIKKEKYRNEKNTFDICFVANKYMPQGIDKGYNRFIEVAKFLCRRYKDFYFHVVGGFCDRDYDISGIENKIKFYGIKNTEFFPNFYSKMDIILSPNIPFVLSSGAFDGFPTGACIEAGLNEVAVFCTDELALNNYFKDHEQIVIIQRDIEKIAELIEYYYNNLTQLYDIALNGKNKLREIFDINTQMMPRISLLKKYLQNI